MEDDLELLMATPGELVKVIASATGEDEATVAQHDRNLVVAGLRTRGGRGRSAAKVTSRDAAMLLTAVLGSHRVKDSAETARRYIETQEHHAHWHKHYPDKLQGMGKANVWEDYRIPEMAALPLDHTFIDALEVLIALAAEGKLIRHLGDFNTVGGLRIFVTSPGIHARISMHHYDKDAGSKSVQADYQSNATPPAWMLDPSKLTPADAPKARPALKRMTEMDATPVLYVGAQLAGELHQLPSLDTT